MARFDVYRGARPLSYVLDCQSDHAGFLETRFVAPLLSAHDTPLVSRLNPVFSVEGEDFALATQLALAVPKRSLQDVVCSLSRENQRIISALDLLISGV